MTTEATDLELTASVDWPAALWAGVIAGIVSFVLYLFFVPAVVGAGNAWVVVRLLGSILLGTSVLAPPATFDAAALVAALVVHFGLAILMALAIAFVLHRWGLITGVLGGAAFGLVFFGINYYTLTYFFPHFFAMAHWSVVLVHVVFGAVAGGVYEWLETEPYERVRART
jgi:hypothetical protein